MLTSGLSSSLCNSFFVLLIHSDFLLYFFCSRILLQNCFVFFASSCWFVLVNYLPTRWSNFLSLFWKILFCFCLNLSRHLWSLSSFANIFSSCMVKLVCCIVSVTSSQDIHLCFSFLSTFAGCRSFYTCFSSQISPSCFVFCSSSFREHRYYHCLVSLLHKLASLVQ